MPLIHSCDSHSLFADLEITGDPTYEKHLNKYPVIFLDHSDFVTRFMLVEINYDRQTKQHTCRIERISQF